MKLYYETTVQDLRVFYSNNMSFPTHLHSQIELLYVIQGTILVSIGDTSKLLSKGDFAIVFPNTAHSYESTGTDSDSRILLAICGLNLTGEYFKKITSYNSSDPFIAKDSLHPNVDYGMRELEQEYYGNKNFDTCRAFIQLILSRTLSVIPLQKNNDLKDYDLTYLIVKYIDEHFQEPLTLTELASQLNVSKYYLSRIFSSKLNTSFNKYINYIRTNYALTLLESTNYTLIRISTESGFESQRTFNRAFKEIYRYSPSEYRRQKNIL